MVAEKVDIPLADLQLDPTNARLLTEPNSQQGIYAALAAQEQRKLVNLANDIVVNGLDPTTLVAVVPTADARRRYRVIEGNRRVLALKALETPSIVSSALSAKDQARLSQLATRYAANPIDPVPCILFQDEEASRHWIELRHTGANDGVGLVEWDSNEKDRFKSRHGAAPRSHAGQVLDFLGKTLPTALPGKGDRITTTLNRVLSSPQIRTKLGLGMVGGELLSHYPAPETAKALGWLVDELRSGRLKTKEVYEAADRTAYANRIPRTVVPPQSKKSSGLISLAALTSGAKPQPKPPKKGKKPTPKPQERASIVPAGCKINPQAPRINTIFNELSQLAVDTFPNSCGVLLRVFLELTIDHYLEQKKVMTETERRAAPLAKRMKTAAASLHTDGKITAQLEKAVEKVANSKDVIAASSATFNQYVHNPYVHPKPSELRTAWLELQPFLEELSA